MTGRIEQLATADSPGVITTKTGRNTFRYSYQFASGGIELQVGRLVAFELEKGNIETAINVCAIEAGESPTVPGRIPEIRYEGFEQKNDVRSFRFRAWRTGEENQDIVVTAEMALFRKYGITIQEGPGLCLRLVEAELQQSNPIPTGLWERKLTADEMIAHIGRQRIPAKRRS
ncbi:MAG: hypothetical protein EHM61_15065 [Acidobacteria bacterium]|nr:MAG: hypothetical protein EHM61_15065 [Acidobacteriota bacterium]